MFSLSLSANDIAAVIKFKERSNVKQVLLMSSVKRPREKHIVYTPNTTKHANTNINIEITLVNYYTPPPKKRKERKGK